MWKMKLFLFWVDAAAPEKNKYGVVAVSQAYTVRDSPQKDIPVTELHNKS